MTSSNRGTTWKIVLNSNLYDIVKSHDNPTDYEDRLSFQDEKHMIIIEGEIRGYDIEFGYFQFLVGTKKKLYELHHNFIEIINDVAIKDILKFKTIMVPTDVPDFPEWLNTRSCTKTTIIIGGAE